MIVKHREIPMTIVQMEALDRRLPVHHVKKELVAQHLLNRWTGFRGEQSVDYALGFLAEEEFYIFQGIRLFDGRHYFQIDNLLVSKWFILILEVKRIAGILQFDPDFNQFTRITEDNLKQPFSDPITQVEMHKNQLTAWIKSHSVNLLPIETLVVSTSSKAILQTSPGDKTIPEKVIHKDSLYFKISELKKKYPHERTNESQLHYLSTLLLQSHSTLVTDILKRYGIPRKDVLTGVQCQSCKHVPLIRKKGGWSCSKCNRTSKTTHLQALKDFSLLINNKITNKEAREFLNIKSQSIAKHLLRSSCAGSIGDTKSRIYIINSI
jgi:hypothetical protein